ncbi:MAG: LON peptidase substrate-binding domain-containing protein, partial [Gammaproteobacteria bacterium]
MLPGGVLPLRIFETRYLDMVSDCMRKNAGFGVCLVKGGRETGVPAGYHETGTLAKIFDWESLPDGLLGITASIESKIRIADSRLEPNGLLVGEVEVLEQETDAPLPKEFSWLSELLANITTELGP